MRAAVIFGPDEIGVVEKTVPTAGPGEVLLRVEAASLCGTDLKIRAGSFFPSQPPPGTFTPGHEYAGTVVALGPTVDEFQVGDRVVVEAHRGCMRCENCVRGRYTACLNYGRPDKGQPIHHWRNIPGIPPPIFVIIFENLPIFFIICCIWLKRLSSVLSSATLTPLPLAMR